MGPMGVKGANLTDEMPNWVKDNRGTVSTYFQGVTVSTTLPK